MSSAITSQYIMHAHVTSQQQRLIACTSESLGTALPCIAQGNCTCLARLEHNNSHCSRDWVMLVCLFCLQSISYGIHARTESCSVMMHVCKALAVICFLADTRLSQLAGSRCCAAQSRQLPCLWASQAGCGACAARTHE